MQCLFADPGDPFSFHPVISCLDHSCSLPNQTVRCPFLSWDEICTLAVCEESRDKSIDPSAIPPSATFLTLCLSSQCSSILCEGSAVSFTVEIALVGCYTPWPLAGLRFYTGLLQQLVTLHMHMHTYTSSALCEQVELHRSYGFGFFQNPVAIHSLLR